MLRVKIAMLLAVISAGCVEGSAKGVVSEDDLNIIRRCVNAITDQAITFNTSTIENLRFGFGGAPSTMTLMTLEGDTINLSIDVNNNPWKCSDIGYGPASN